MLVKTKHTNSYFIRMPFTLCCSYFGFKLCKLHYYRRFILTIIMLYKLYLIFNLTTPSLLRKQYKYCAITKIILTSYIIYVT